MSRRLLALIPIALGASAWLHASETDVQVQLSFYPYYHDPAPAWRATILENGAVRCEKSVQLVKTWSVPSEAATEWVAQSECPSRRVSAREQRRLLAELRALGLDALAQHYSAEFSYTDPVKKTRVITASGDSYTEPATVSRVITHGGTYGLRVSLSDVSVESFVYAPFEALERQSPENPDRAAIAKFISAWYYVLKVIGAVNGHRARMFRGR